jgi:hypothetical protein
MQPISIISPINRIKEEKKKESRGKKSHPLNRQRKGL